MTAIFNYLTAATPLPQYLPYARFLLDTDLSHTAKLLYTLLLDRATLSQKNNWIDTQGRIYVLYPLSSLAKDLRSIYSKEPLGTSISTQVPVRQGSYLPAPPSADILCS